MPLRNPLMTEYEETCRNWVLSKPTLREEFYKKIKKEYEMRGKY